MTTSSAKTLRIWSNYPFQEPAVSRLRCGIGAHQFIEVDPAVEQPDAGETPDILVGQPDAEFVRTAASVRWVEITSAGYTRYDRDDLRAALRARGAALTNTSRVFDEACAQHLVAMVLALARELPRCLDNQRGERAWLHDEVRVGRRFLLNGQSAILYGYGTIARRVVEILRPLGMRLIGVRRRPQGDEAIPMLTETEADARLAEMDLILNILPASESTRHYFDAARFARCKRGARFYNIGRGATVDQEALIAALERGRLEAAYLDVTDPEPLPTDHPLWDAPNCLITPHIAGTHDNEEERLVDHFLANLRAFEAGRPLVDRVV